MSYPRFKCANIYWRYFLGAIFRIWVRNGYWSLRNMFFIGAVFFYSRENLFDAVNILFDWYDQIIESLWEKKQEQQQTITLELFIQPFVYHVNKHSWKNFVILSNREIICREHFHNFQNNTSIAEHQYVCVCVCACTLHMACGWISANKPWTNNKTTN